MITIELQSVPEGRSDYESVASMTVADDGTYRLVDPEGLFPVDLHVLVVDDAGALRQVRIEDDAATWARHLDSVLRSGQLVPVITHDDNSPAEDLP